MVSGETKPGAGAAERGKDIFEVIREGRVGRIDFLKIDVQKSEFDVLAGTDEADWPKIRQLVIEVQDRA
jgi:FkbM family methyltransferase